MLIGCATSKLKLEKLPKKENFFRISWVKNLDPSYDSGNLPIGTSSPFIFQDILYMGDLSGKMSAFDVETGRVIWQVQEDAPIQSQVNKLGDVVYYGTKNGRLFARNYLTGKLVYATDLGAPIESQPSFVAGRLIVHLRNHSIITLDARTGKIFWNYKRSVPFLTTLQRVSQLLPYKNNVIIGFADGYIVSLSLEEGVVNWEQKLSTGVKFVDVDVKPVFFEGYIVAGSAAGPLRMLNPQNGVIEKTVEIYQSHTPLILGDQLVVGDIYGKVYRLDSYGKVKEENKLTKEGISSIKKWKDSLVVTTMGSEVFQLSKGDLKIKSEFNLGHAQSAVFGESYVGDENLAIYSSRNRLYVFE